MMFAQKDFEIEDVLSEPLMAHLSTVEDGAPAIPQSDFFGKIPTCGFSGRQRTALKDLEQSQCLAMKKGVRLLERAVPGDLLKSTLPKKKN